MEEKINYQKNLIKTLDLLEKIGKKPRLLLHACCGCCLTIPLKQLEPYFDVTIFYNNSNIYPASEYHRRFEELKRYIKEINSPSKVVEMPYDNDSFTNDLLPLKDEREGGRRCKLCFEKRLEPGFEYASKNGFEYFCTVMTISRYKNSQVLNQLGNELATKYPTVKWLEADFKKNDGYQKSLEIVREHNMYFQQYCGCKFSYEAYLSKIKG